MQPLHDARGLAAADSVEGFVLGYTSLLEVYPGAALCVTATASATAPLIIGCMLMRWAFGLHMRWRLWLLSQQRVDKGNWRICGPQHRSSWPQQAVIISKDYSFVAQIWSRKR